MAEDRIVVAGGGLGGLGVALGLAQNGKRAVVLEKAPSSARLALVSSLARMLSMRSIISAWARVRANRRFTSNSFVSWMR